MRDFCRFHKSGVSVLLLLTAVLASCQTQAPPPQPPKAADFNTLLKNGDYAAAIAWVTAAPGIAANEKDGVIGTLILDGLVDPKASSKPPYKLADGFERLEKAALAGRPQSVSDLRAKFTTGINYEGKNSLMPANEALAKCWTSVEALSNQAQACVDLRKSLRVP
jgi:hypothetical protein